MTNDDDQDDSGDDRKEGKKGVNSQYLPFTIARVKERRNKKANGIINLRSVC